MIGSTSVVTHEHPLSEARAAARRQDWKKALDIWCGLEKSFNDLPEVHLGQATALREMGRHADAEQTLASAVLRFPDSVPLSVAYAWIADLRHDKESARRRWLALVERFPNDAAGYCGVAAGLRNERKYDDAETLILEALARFPGNGRLLVQFAWVAHYKADWHEALIRWNGASDKSPDECLLGRCIALRRLGRLSEAEFTLKAAIAKFPNTASFLAEEAELAAAKKDWPRAKALWGEIRTRFPHHPSSVTGGEALLVAELKRVDAALDSGDTTISGDSSAALSDAGQLLMNFESLGANCEFGLLQRFYGAEPLGLLRWANILPTTVTEGLLSRFDGLGDPTEMEIVTRSDGEYHIKSKKYEISFHTFDRENQTDSRSVFLKHCRRVAYLKRKLIEDLESLEKIFVYQKSALNDSEIFALYHAVRDYGANTLLCVRVAEQPNQIGEVRQLDDGLFVGHIDTSMRGGPFKGWSVSCDVWLKLCREAHSQRGPSKKASHLSVARF